MWCTNALCPERARRMQAIKASADEMGKQALRASADETEVADEMELVERARFDGT